MKKMITWIMVLVMALSLTSFAAAEEAVTLRLWMWDDAQQPAMRAMADEYEASHPNVTIEISCQADVSGLNQRIQATIGTSDAPEIFFMNYNLAAEYIPLGIVADLTPYDIDQSDLASGIVNAYTVDGKVYAVAKDTDSYAVFYNKALFDQAGVPYPDDSWTIADFCETAKKMTSDGVVGWTSSTSDRVWYNFIWSNGGQIYSEDGTTAAINTPESAEVIQMLMDLSANGYAYIDEDGMLTVHSKSIGIHLHMPMIADGIGVTMDKLRLVQNHAGGTFGYKFSPTNEAILGVAALVCQRPVSLNFNMYQSITYTGKRSPGFMHIKLAADDNGKVLALWGDNYIDHGPYSEFGDLLTHRLSQFVGAGFDIPTIRNKSTTVFTNHAWGSAFRAYGSPQSFMGSDIAMDIMAAKLGMDPFEFRAMNCYKESEDSRTPNGCRPDVYCEEDLFNLARPYYEAAKKRVAEKNAASDGKIKYGIGVSLGVYGCGLDNSDASECWADLNPDGTVTLRNSWEDHGQGADIATLTAGHETLRQAGFTPEMIHLEMNDTKLTPNSGPAGGSRSTVMTGSATRVACENLLKAMRKPDGTYRTYDEMKAEGIDTHAVGVYTYTASVALDQATSQGEPFPTYMYTIFLPEVAVNTETGKVKVEKFTAVADVGTILNKLAVDGNFYGGLVQGIGLALTEDFEDLKKHTSLAKCGIPYPNDAPDDIELVYQTNHPRPNGPYGASGCGEAPLDAPHPAILNAIYNATGARITRVPALPSVVLEALKQVKA